MERRKPVKCLKLSPFACVDPFFVACVFFHQLCYDNHELNLFMLLLYANFKIDFLKKFFQDTIAEHSGSVGRGLGLLVRDSTPTESLSLSEALYPLL